WVWRGLSLDKRRRSARIWVIVALGFLLLALFAYGGNVQGRLSNCRRAARSTRRGRFCRGNDHRDLCEEVDAALKSTASRLHLQDLCEYLGGNARPGRFEASGT